MVHCPTLSEEAYGRAGPFSSALCIHTLHHLPTLHFSAFHPCALNPSPSNASTDFFIHLFIYLVFVCGSHELTWRLENNSRESVLSFHFIGPGNRTYVVKLGSRCLYLTSQPHLPNISWFLLLGHSGTEAKRM